MTAMTAATSGSAERRPVPAGARGLRSAGVGGLARGPLRRPAGPDAGVRRHRPGRAGPADGGLRGRALPAAAAGRAREGAQAHGRAAPQRTSRSIWRPSGPKNLELAGEIADGWLAVFFAPEFADEQLGQTRAGRRRRAADLGGFDVVRHRAARWSGADPRACADPVRRYAALYLGGMGSREQNFYNALAVRMGFAEAAGTVQDLYLRPSASGRDGGRAVRVHRLDVAARQPGADRGAAGRVGRRRGDDLLRWPRTVTRWRRSSNALDGGRRGVRAGRGGRAQPVGSGSSTPVSSSTATTAASAIR